MYKRFLASKLKSLSQQYPVIALTGPRQSGKTTLVKMLFPEKHFISLEEVDVRDFAIEDPRRFLGQFREGAILDEVQRVPHLFSYIQTIVDQKQKKGMFVLTGSSHFMLMENISQSLAGRVAILKLLPLSIFELQEAHLLSDDINKILFTGFYPRVYYENLICTEWFSNYVETYIEKDIRSLKNISNLNLFYRFLRLCAGRAGQILNLSSMANECGINHNTARAWLTLLEISFIVFLLQTHYKNFNKRLIKSPKLYFYDTGLLCYLLGIKDKDYLNLHPARGEIFENFIISELFKNYYNKGQNPDLYYWRDQSGHEIDCLIERNGKLIPLEIKSGETITSDFFKNIYYWQRLSASNQGYIIYGGNNTQMRENVKVIPWSNLKILY